MRRLPGHNQAAGKARAQSPVDVCVCVRISFCYFLYNIALIDWSYNLRERIAPVRGIIIFHEFFHVLFFFISKKTRFEFIYWYLTTRICITTISIQNRATTHESTRLAVFTKKKKKIIHSCSIPYINQICHREREKERKKTHVRGAQSVHCIHRANNTLRSPRCARFV